MFLDKVTQNVILNTNPLLILMKNCDIEFITRYMTNPDAPAVIHPGRIAGDAVIGNGSLVLANVKIGYGTIIDSKALILPNVTIGPRVRIGRAALLMTGARVCPDDVADKSSNARELGHGVTIGENVVLDNAVEIGDGAIIPAQNTIATIGKFGDKQRTVTIYGSDDGPRFSIGCNIGVDLGLIKEHVAGATYTSVSSASAYDPYIGVFESIGKVVQEAYRDNHTLIDEIRQFRLDVGLDSTN